MQWESILDEREMRSPAIDIVNTVLRAARFFRNKIRDNVQMQESLKLRWRIEHLDDTRPEMVCGAAGRSGQEIMRRMGSDDERADENGQRNDEQKEHHP